MISAKIVADSVDPRGNRLTTMMVTFPRFILAELNTHRLFSRNSASSRAIPFGKALKSVISNPFVPIAVQKHHSGMQGTEYLDMDREYTYEEIRSELHEFLVKNFKNKDGSWDEDYVIVDEVLNKYVLPLLNNGDVITWRKWWLKARDLVVAAATISFAMGATKQICNRLLEPFMWHAVLITASEWHNFFDLRCPQYHTPVSGEGFYAKSWKELQSWHSNPENEKLLEDNKDDILFKLQHNKGQSEIHMMALAEAMYDAMNESTPEQLKAGEWHIPFFNVSKPQLLREIRWNPSVSNMVTEDVMYQYYRLRIAIARCARVSYTVVGEEGKEHSYEKDIQLHDSLLSSGHFSPFEHCARVMTDEEYCTSLKGTDFHKYVQYKDSVEEAYMIEDSITTKDPRAGWCNNYKGFIQYRYLIETKQA